MGAQISKENDEAQIKTLEEALAALYSHYGVTDQIQHLLIDLPFTSREELQGVSKARLIQIGPTYGDPVLFVHGGGGSPSDWAPVFPILAGQSSRHRFLFVERPGHGLSDPFDYSKVDDLQGHGASFLLAVLDALDISNVDLVGNSLGGGYTVWMAQRYPERVKSLSLVGCPAIVKGMESSVSFYFLGTWLGKQIMAQTPPANVPVELLKDTFCQDMEKVPQEAITALHCAMSVRGNSLSWQSLLSRGTLLFSSNNPVEWPPEVLGEISKKLPCQFMVGIQDNFCSQGLQETLASMCGQEKVDIVGQGHLPWYDDPQGVVDRILKFVDAKR